MTTEEKARAYDEALERARKLYESYNRLVLSTDEIERIFPQLAESEDERIRKELIEAFEVYDIESSWNLIPVKHILAWLEKQKEQKPSIFPPGLGEVHWNPIPSGKDVHKWTLPKDFEEAVYKVANFISPFDNQEELRKVSHRFAEQLLSLAKKELDKPAEWSEEDEKMMECCLVAINHYEKTCNIGDYLPTKFNIGGYLASVDKVKSWLKSLRPSWKPSEEQMKAIKHAYNSFPNDCSTKLNLRLLYHDLQKLI